ncbi:MAG: hypothetical protein ABSA02_34195 [Trebonia sp.]
MAGVERAEVMVRMTFGPNRGIGFSPDGALLAVCSAQHVEIIDARGGALVTLSGHLGAVQDVAFSPGGKAPGHHVQPERAGLGCRDRPEGGVVP